MRAPPHKEVLPMLRNTTHGYSFGSTSLPPNILLGLLGIPQLHVELPGVVVRMAVEELAVGGDVEELYSVL